MSRCYNTTATSFGGERTHMKFIETVKKMLPGCAIALVIAVVAKFLEQLEESAGLHLIGASWIAMLIRMIVSRI